MLFSSAELANVTNGALLGASFDGISSLVIDSRDVPQGALFVAIKGDRFDGHQFVAAAIASGAAAALVSEQKLSELDTSLPLVAVTGDPLVGLRKIAAAARARFDGPVVAVTGSVGKTTTKDALRHVLSGFGTCHASIKSYNNHWGVPLMLANLPLGADFGLFEMGMNHSGEITPLTRLVRPQAALITAIAPAHIGELGSMEAIVRAKAEVFTGLEPNGTAIINVDHDFGQMLVDLAREAGAGKILTYGFSRDADVVIDFASSSRAEITQDARSITLTSQAPGKHMLSNLVGAGLVANELGFDWSDIAPRLATFAAPQGRGASTVFDLQHGKLTLVDESYNANPASMRAALDVFSQSSFAGQRVLVLGDMRELGEQSAHMHADLANAVIAARPSELFLVGPEMKNLTNALGRQAFDVHWAETVTDCALPVLDLLDQGGVVMLKGSNSVGLGTLVSRIEKKFGGDQSPH